MKKIIMGKADSKWRIADKVEYELKDLGIIKVPQSYCYVELEKK